MSSYDGEYFSKRKSKSILKKITCIRHFKSLVSVNECINITEFSYVINTFV